MSTNSCSEKRFNGECICVLLPQDDNGKIEQIFNTHLNREWMVFLCVGGM